MQSLRNCRQILAAPSQNCRTAGLSSTSLFLVGGLTSKNLSLALVATASKAADVGILLHGTKIQRIQRCPHARFLVALCGPSGRIIHVRVYQRELEDSGFKEISRLVYARRLLLSLHRRRSVAILQTHGNEPAPCLHLGTLYQAIVFLYLRSKSVRLMFLFGHFPFQAVRLL